MENDNCDEQNHVFKGPDDEQNVIFDPKDLKKITVKILRKNPQNSVPSLRREIFNPATVAPVRRPDEGKRPIFARREILNFVPGDSVPEGDTPSKASNEKRKKDSASPPQAARRRTRSRSRTRSRTPRRHHSHSPSEPNSRRRSKERSRSPRSPPRHRRGRSYRSRSGSHYRSRSRSYERRRRSRTRSHSRGRRRSPHSRDREFSDHYPMSRFIKEKKYLKALILKQLEDKHLTEEVLRRKEKAEQEPKDAVLHEGGGGRMRGPPRMRPPMVHFRPMMVPFPPPHPMFRAPPFRPYPPFRPPNARFHHPEF